MNRNANNIKQRKQENKKLELETKKMEEELDRIRIFKAMEIEKEKLKQQMKELQQQNQPEPQQDVALRGYGQKLKKETEDAVRKRLQNKILMMPDSSSSEEQDNDSQNLKYFLDVLALPQYFNILVNNKITSLVKLRQLDESASKKLGIPLKDLIKINKKLRSMGY